jgi:Tfp pilus assembly protein PilF
MRRAGQRAAASADAGWQLAFARGASLVYLNSGDWAAAHAFSEDAMKLARQLGDFYLLVASLHYQALMAFRLGDEATFAARSAEMLAVVKHNPSPQFRRAYPLAMGTRALRRGQLDAARELLQEAWQYVQQSRDSLGIIAVRGQMALCALRLGDPAAARAAADETLEHIRKTSPTSEVLGEGFSSVAEVYLELWERGSAAEREQLAAPLRQALRALRRCGLVFPTTAPRAFLWHSRYLWNQGHHRLARALAESSLRRARALKLPHDEALATAWLLRYRGEPPPKR